MITVGLDVSTSITGISVFDEEKLILTKSVNTSKKAKFPTPESCAFEVRKALKELKLNPDVIVIEESLKKFARGKSSANTIIVLSQINALISFIAEDLYGIKPIKLSASKARKTLGISIPKKSSSKEKKQIILDHIDNIFGDSFNYEMTHFGNPKAESFDRADAVVIALGYLNNKKNE